MVLAWIINTKTSLISHTWDQLAQVKRLNAEAPPTSALAFTLPPAGQSLPDTLSATPKKRDVLTQLQMFNIYHSRQFLLTSNPQVDLRGHDHQDANISQEIGIQDQQILWQGLFVSFLLNSWEPPEEA